MQKEAVVIDGEEIVFPDAPRRSTRTRTKRNVIIDDSDEDEQLEKEEKAVPKKQSARVAAKSKKKNVIDDDEFIFGDSDEEQKDDDNDGDFEITTSKKGSATTTTAKLKTASVASSSSLRQTSQKSKPISKDNFMQSMSKYAYKGSQSDPVSVGEDDEDSSASLRRLKPKNAQDSNTNSPRSTRMLTRKKANDADSNNRSSSSSNDNGVEMAEGEEDVEVVDDQESQELQVDDGAGEYEEAQPEATDTVELILAARKFEGGEVRYLIKKKETSYRHLEWVPENYFDAFATSRTKLKRFKQNLSYVPNYDEKEIMFDKDLTKIDRVIAETYHGGQHMFYVKWKSLPYESATWELESDVSEPEDKAKIVQFQRFKKVPSAQAAKIPQRPPPSSFKKLKESPVFKNDHKLRDYQLEGLNWLVNVWFHRRNTILADEMGLGKTVQTVSIIEYLRTTQHIRGPFLVIAPLSTLGHWQREFENWTDQNVIVFHGSEASRNIIKEYEWFYTDEKNKPIKSFYKFNTIITTYEMILAESSFLGRIRWQYIAIDEGHRLKNRKSKLMEALMAFHSEHLLLLTGTPLQNNVAELFSLLSFLDPKTFDSEEQFLENYGNLKDSTQVKNLQEVIRPYMLRRLKEDVEKSIPPKEEIIVEVEPTLVQKKYYKAILDKNRDFLKRGQNVPSLINVLMELRKCCNHPYLIKGAEERIVLEDNRDGLEPNELMIRVSAKLVLTDKLLKKLKEGNHKVLIFSQMTSMLNILQDFLDFRGYRYERIDGGIKGLDRQAAIDRFSKGGPDSSFVFLMTTKAGGVGINLTAADTVIIYDSDWNPQNDLQAQARCHRIGQKNEVKIYRLVTKNTREKDLVERAFLKLGLDKAVLDPTKLASNNNDNDEGAATSKNKIGLDKDEINALLKYGAFNMLKADNGEEERRLLEDDIDRILERSSKVMRFDDPEARSAEGSTFSKATFITSGEEELDINDEDFWEKALAEVTPNRLLAKLTAGTTLSENEKVKFMRDLKGLVDDTLHSIAYGERNAWKADDLISLLIQVTHDEQFDEEQRVRAREWFEELEHPQVRRRSRGDGSDRHGADDSDAESDAAASENDSFDDDRKLSKQLDNKVRRQIIDVKKQLYITGFTGRWRVFREQRPILQSKSLYWIHQICNAILEMFIDYEPDNKSFYKGLIDQFVAYRGKLVNIVEKETDPEELALPDTTFYPCQQFEITPPKSVLPNSSLVVLVKRLAETDDNENANANKEPTVIYQHIVAADETKKILFCAPGLRGHFVFELLAASKARPVEKTEEENKEGSEEEAEEKEEGTAAAGSESDVFTIVARSKPCQVAGIHPVMNEEEFLDSIKKSKGHKKKWQLNQDLHELCNRYGASLEDLPIYLLTADESDSNYNPLIKRLQPLADWWKPEHDRQLLLESYESGNIPFPRLLSNFKDRLKNKAEEEADSEDKLEVVDDDEWPDAKDLANKIPKRVGVLLELFLQKKKGKTAAPSAASASASSATTSGSSKITSTWNKSEKARFHVTVLKFGSCPNAAGEPQFDQFMIKASIDKTKDLAAVEEYFNDYVAKCEAISKKAALAGKSSANDDDDDGKKEDGEDFTPQTAKKILYHIRLLSQFMIAEPHITTERLQKLNNTIGKSRIPKELPNWWTHKHDLALVSAAKRHAFDFKKWTEKDDEFAQAFKKDGPQPQKVPRTGLLTSRLEYICSYVTNATKSVPTPPKATSSSSGAGSSKKRVVPLDDDSDFASSSDEADMPAVKKPAVIKKKPTATLQLVRPSSSSSSSATCSSGYDSSDLESNNPPPAASSKSKTKLVLKSTTATKDAPSKKKKKIELPSGQSILRFVSCTSANANNNSNSNNNNNNNNNNEPYTNDDDDDELIDDELIASDERSDRPSSKATTDRSRDVLANSDISDVEMSDLENGTSSSSSNRRISSSKSPKSSHHLHLPSSTSPTTGNGNNGTSNGNNGHHHKKKRKHDLSSSDDEDEAWSNNDGAVKPTPYTIKANKHSSSLSSSSVVSAAATNKKARVMITNNDSYSSSSDDNNSSNNNKHHTTTTTATLDGWVKKASAVETPTKPVKTKKPLIMRSTKPPAPAASSAQAPHRQQQQQQE